jgi:CRISPR-associated protein Csh1
VERLFSYLAKQDEILVYHFVFWEENQAQEQLHVMVEDVPPSRLKCLERLWQETYKVLLWKDAGKTEFRPEDIGVDLDQAFKTVYSTLISLSGKDEADKNIMRKRIINIISKLLGGKTVDVEFVKQLMVSRFAGLFANTQWIRFGHWELRKMMAVLEFLGKVNDWR